MRVLLADPPLKGTRIDDSYPNLGLLYLASAARKFLNGNVEVDYIGPKHDLASHLERVKQFRPHVYGIGFTSKSPRVAYETITAVRDACPKTTIVAGGCHPTALPYEVLKNSPADVLVTGEGETTFCDLLQRLDGYDNLDLDHVQGLYFRKGDKIIATEPRALISDLDSIPFPAWDLVDFHEYRGMFLKRQPIESSLLISRGCPFNCVFCSQPIWKYHKPWLRSRSPANICEEIDVLYDRGVREIYLSSDELNFNEKWAIDLCRQIERLNHKDLYFQCNMRADKISENLAEALVSINCWLVHLGIESANNRVLQGIGKNVTVEQVENSLKLLTRVGVKIFAFMMLYQAWDEDGKLYFETNEEVENSLRWVKRMFKQKLIHYMSWQFCTPMPGAQLYDIARRHNLYLGNPEDVWENFDEHNVCMKLPGISLRTMRWKLKKGIFIKDWFMLRSGAISWHHLWRVWENLRALVK
jgi:radical SAM superfamily enzyme YgiQ (UPF0313 family)